MTHGIEQVLSKRSQNPLQVVNWLGRSLEVVTCIYVTMLDYFFYSSIQCNQTRSVKRPAYIKTELLTHVLFMRGLGQLHINTIKQMTCELPGD